MPVIMPATVPVGMVRDWQSRGERAIARIAGPLPTGKSLVKHNGTWRCVRTPSQRFLDECAYVFLGGHEYVISDELLAEIQGAVGDDCQPHVLSRNRITEDGRTRITEDGRTRVLEDA